MSASSCSFREIGCHTAVATDVFPPITILVNEMLALTTAVEAKEFGFQQFLFGIKPAETVGADVIGGFLP